MQHEYNEADLIEQDKQAELDRLDAQRYRKLKAYLEELRSRGIGVLNLQRHAWDYDAAVDALPDGGKQ